MKPTFRKILTLTLLTLALILLATLPVHAQDATAETLPDAYADIENALPDQVLDLLPDGFFSQNPQDAMTSVQSTATPDYLWQTIWRMVGGDMDTLVKLLLTTLGLVILSSLLRQLKTSTTRSGEGFLFCLRLCMYTLMVGNATQMLAWVRQYFETLQALMQAMIPVMGVLYALGGNVSEATLNHQSLLLLLNLCQFIATTLSPALCGACLAFSLMDAFGGQVQIKCAPLSGLCKKWYTTLLGFLVFLITATLSVQSVITAKADTLGMRGMKYAIGQMLPVVGGGLSGVLGSVAAGVGLLRGVAGMSGVILVLLLVLPTLVQLLLMRGIYQLTSALAGMLSCEGESKLLGEVGSLYGYLAATVSICGVAFVIALAIFAQGSVALGGG